MIKLEFYIDTYNNDMLAFAMGYHVTRIGEKVTLRTRNSDDGYHEYRVTDVDNWYDERDNSDIHSVAIVVKPCPAE